MFTPFLAHEVDPHVLLVFQLFNGALAWDRIARADVSNVEPDLLQVLFAELPDSIVVPNGLRLSTI
jgi:hypothetical protein